MTTPDGANPGRAALQVLAVAQTLMLAAMMARLQPHPPGAVPFFALGPFLTAAISLCVGALALGGTATRSGRLASGLAALAALVSFGPQKWFDAAFPLIWPTVVLAQLAILVLGLACVRAHRAEQAGRHV